MKTSLKLLSSAVVVGSLLLGSVRSGGAQSNASLHTLPVESSMRVHELEAAQDALEEVHSQQLEVVETLTAEFSHFLYTMHEVGAEVAEATNAWVANPTPETEAAVTLAIARGAERGHQVARTVAALGEKVGPMTRVLRDRLQGHIRETRQEARNAHRKARRLESAHQQMHEAALEAKYILEARGYTATSSLPPELADSLTRLEMEYFESAMRAEIQRELGPLLEDYETVLEQADRDYRRVAQLARLVSDQAGSMGRVLSHLGAVEGQKVEIKLGADMFAQSAGLRDRLTAVAGQFQQVHRNMSRLVTASRRLPRIERPAQTRAEDREQTAHGVDWLWNLDREDAR